MFPLVGSRMAICSLRIRLLSQFPRCLSSLSLPESESRISTAVTTLLHHGSKTRYNHLRSTLLLTGPTATSFSPSESANIILRIRNRPHLALRFFNSSLCSSRDLQTLSTIIHVTARARLKPTALSLIRSAILTRPESDDPLALFRSLARSYRACGSAPFVFDLLIKAYLQLNKVDRAVEIFRILKSRNIRPLIETSNLLIRSVSRFNGSGVGFEIYKEIFRDDDNDEVRARVRVLPNVKTFNTLLLAFYRDGRLEMAEEIKREMKRFDCKANAFTYGILMAGLCDEGMIDEATEAWIEMVRNGIRPDLITFNTMIKGFCEGREMVKAEELFKEMGLSEIEPSCATFEHLIRGYCTVKDVDSALVLCTDTKRRGLGIESLVVDEVVEGLCERERVSEALGFMREEMRIEGFEANQRCYELLIEGFCKEGDMETATELQAEMAGKGFEVNLKVYGDFIEGYRRIGDVAMAKRLTKEMLEMGNKN